MAALHKTMSDHDGTALVDHHDSKDQLSPQPEGIYNPLSYPPDIKKAHKHARAKRVGRIDLKDTEMEFCEDCGLPSKNEELPLCGTRLDMADLGAGFPLYFEYIYFCGFILLGLFLIVGIYSLVVNKRGMTCDIFQFATDATKYCSGGFIINYSLGNRGYNFPGDFDKDDDNAFKVINILNIIFVIIALLACFYYRRIQNMTADEVDRGSITTSDYSVIIEDVPITETSESIKKFFEEKGRAKLKAVVKKVVLSYEIGPYVDLVRKRNNLQAKKLKSSDKTMSPEEIDKELKDLDEKINAFESAVSKNSTHKFTGIAFITFASEQESKDVVKKFAMGRAEKAFWSFFGGFFRALGVKHEKHYNGKLFRLKRAPEPFDVFWENLGYPWWEVQKKRILTLLTTGFLIAISLGMILGITILQSTIISDTKTGKSSAAVTLLSLLSSFLITLINGFIGFFMRKLAGYEKHTTYTYYFVSIAEKLSLAQFFNTALVTFFVQLILHRDGLYLWTRDGLVPKVFFLFALNAVMPSITYILNPFYIMRVLKRNRIESEGADSKVTQQEANLTFEGPPFDVAQRYANVQKTMLFTAFYASLLPIGVPISLAGLILTYWTDKYMLLRRHCRPTTLSKELAEEMADFLELIVVAFCAGNCWFSSIARDEVGALNWISLIIAAVFYILPNQFMASCILRNDDKIYNVKTYDQVKFHFPTEYDRVNPITQEEAMREWMMEMSRLAEGNQAMDANVPTNRAEKPFDHLKNMPKMTTMSNLANYANAKPSFQQMNNMTLGTNFMGSQVNNPMMMNPAFGNPAYPQNPMFNQFNPMMRYFGKQMNQLGLMPQPHFGPMQQPQPGYFMNPSNNNSTHVLHQNPPNQFPQPMNTGIAFQRPYNNSPQMPQSNFTVNVQHQPIPMQPQIQAQPIIVQPQIQHQPQPIMMQSQPVMMQPQTYQRAPLMAQPQVIQINQANPYMGQSQPQYPSQNMMAQQRGYQQAPLMQNPQPMYQQQQQQQPQPQPQSNFDAQFRNISNQRGYGQ